MMQPRLSEFASCRKAGPLLPGKKYTSADQRHPTRRWQHGQNACTHTCAHAQTHTHTGDCYKLGSVANGICSYSDESKVQTLWTGMDMCRTGGEKGRLEETHFGMRTNMRPTVKLLEMMPPAQVKAPRGQILIYYFNECILFRARGTSR